MATTYNRFRWSNHRHLGGVPSDYTEKVQAVYSVLNTVLFSNRLPTCSVRILSRANKLYLSNRYGLSDWAGVAQYKPNGKSWIFQCEQEVKTQSFARVLSTLVHEMCHIEDGLMGSSSNVYGHTDTWAFYMTRVGLQPIPRCGDHATHEIIDGGPFDCVFQGIMY